MRDKFTEEKVIEPEFEFYYLTIFINKKKDNAGGICLWNLIK